MKHNISLVIIFSGLLITSCTNSGSSSTSISSLIGDIIGTTPEASKTAEKQVQEIQASLNQDPNYQLTTEDQNLLVSESLIDDQSEIKSWVK